MADYKSPSKYSLLVTCGILRAAIRVSWLADEILLIVGAGINCWMLQTLMLPFFHPQPLPSPHPYSRLPTSGKPRDHKSALRVSGGVPRENVGIRAGRGAKGGEGEGKVGERPSSPGGVVNRLLCLQDFVSLELLRVSRTVRSS